MSRRILLIQLKRIGDVILTAPAIHELRLREPSAEIVLLVPEGALEIAQAMPVDQVLSYRASLSTAALWASIAVGEWHACYDFTGTDRSAALVALSRAKQRWGYSKFSSKGLRQRAYTDLCLASVRDLHTVDFHRALLGLPTGIAVCQGSLRFATNPRDLPESYAVVHPGTARQEKFWPSDRWAEVVHALSAKGLQVVLTGTGTGLEAAPLQQLKNSLQVPVTDLTGQLSLAETAAVIAGSRLALGVDSMAMHLAALAGIPQVVLFGPTNPYQWRPLQPLARVMTPSAVEPTTTFAPKTQGGLMTDISVPSVLGAINELLAIAS
jgi:ADP-heptose:LPS heptosyltransferase